MTKHFHPSPNLISPHFDCVCERAWPRLSAYSQYACREVDSQTSVVVELCVHVSKRSEKLTQTDTICLRRYFYPIRNKKKIIIETL